MFLISSSSFTNDIPDFDSCSADISIRLPQKFRPLSGETLSWYLVRLNDSQILDDGEIIVSVNNLVTVTNLILYKDPCRLIISNFFVPETVLLPLAMAGYFIFLVLFHYRDVGDIK